MQQWFNAMVFSLSEMQWFNGINLIEMFHDLISLIQSGLFLYFYPEDSFIF